MTDAPFETRVADMPQPRWLHSLPPGLRPYARLMRLDRPVGTWLLLLPCWWSLALAAQGFPDFGLLAWFALGAVIMRGAGCTLNDILDRHFDAQVARTHSRPIPAGEVSVRQALLFLGVLLLLGLLVLVQMNALTIGLGVASLGLVGTYPLMKRVTWWPQLFLGLTFNWGTLMGWSAATGTLGVPPFLLYLAGIFWTLGYDTIYAHQDREDDAVIGVKSTARLLGTHSRMAITGFYGLALLALALAGSVSGLSWWFSLLLGVAAAHLAWQVMTLDIDDPVNCSKRFRANRNFGLIIFMAFLLG